MKSREARDLGRVIGASLRQVSATIGGAHRATSALIHAAVGSVVGPTVVPVKVTTDTVTAGVYAVTGWGLDVLARVGGRAAAHRLAPEDPQRESLHDGPRAPLALAVGLGLRGDGLARRGPTLAPSLHLRAGGRPVDLDAAGLARAYPRATSELAVFVHGLFETEAVWHLGAPGLPSYGDRLEGDLGFTPVMVRYNTGLPIVENARELDAVLTDLVAAWPVPVARIVLVGHSMGGLVIHQGVECARTTGPPWLTLATDTISLGTPHHGSPVARAVARTADHLGNREASRWLAEVLGLRSAGIRDLEHGSATPAEVATPAHPRHHAVVAATAGRWLPTEVSDHLGDLVVPVASARGERDGAHTFSPDRVAVIDGLTHLGLVNSQAVYARLGDWLSPD